MDTIATKTGLAPFSLKDAPALIERVFPAQKVGAEAQKERKAVRSQTLPTLGSYWKGRKPLVLVRACLLACLLPATDDLEKDIEIFDALMGMDEASLLARGPKVTASVVANSPAIPSALLRRHLEITASQETSEANADDAEDDDEDRSAVQARWRGVSEILAELDEDNESLLQDLRQEREQMLATAFKALPFAQKVAICERVEQIEKLGDHEDGFRRAALAKACDHLGIHATTLPDLIKKLGEARFGRHPRVGDTFSGGGSIPFEAARVGCEAIASDLNPVAAMLTWGAFNIVGGDAETRRKSAYEQQHVVAAVDAEMCELGYEHDEHGNRAKAFLYCLEVLDPQTGWLVPLLPSFVIAPKLKLIARLKPDPLQKRFDIEIVRASTKKELDALRATSKQDAGKVKFGTVQESDRQDPDIVYAIPVGKDGELREYKLSMARLRGDGAGPVQSDGSRSNLLRRWGIDDIQPRPLKWDAKAPPVMTGSAPGRWIGDEILQERLYCIQWMKAEDLEAGVRRPSTFYAAPTPDDQAREVAVASFVSQNLKTWQKAGWVPDMAIESGDKTDEPIRTRGWTYWHHLFNPRQLLTNGLFGKHIREANGEYGSILLLPKIIDNNARLVRWKASQGGGLGGPVGIFSNQALNTLYNYAARGVRGFDSLSVDVKRDRRIYGETPAILVHGSKDIARDADLWIYDPPYADAVHYHEITEFFIAWLRRNPPAPFDQWTWDSKRPLAIQGKGEKFRSDMVASFRAMAEHMPSNGLQVCMFTHKDAGVWADLAQIVWAAGLKVTAAWYVSTETTSDQKQGGYVQGTVLLVLRKRAGSEHGFRSDIVPEVRDRVAKQVETLTGLNQRVRGRGRDENVFSDADIQMAGYAAALEVLTAYTHIDGVDMTREALRPRDGRRNTEVGIVEEMISLAVQTANELMVPEGIAEGMWERFSPEERFYLKMTASEATWPVGQIGGKLDDYQNFARVYRAAAWEDLMAERSPNKARLKGAAEFKRTLMTGHNFSEGSLRPTLYAIAEQWRATAKEEDPKDSGDRILHFLRDHFGLENWTHARQSVRALAAWLGTVWERQRPEEAAAARVVAGLIASERLAG